jgi:hypothetical protein
MISSFFFLFELTQHKTLFGSTAWTPLVTSQSHVMGNRGTLALTGLNNAM